MSQRLAKQHASNRRKPSTLQAGGERGSTRGVTLVERAYREIRRRILENQYPPAHQALEQELAAEMGMSRTPVREALVRLQNENLVQLIPRHGMRVVPLSVRDLHDLYEAHTALELAAVERLARSRPDGQVLAPLRKMVDDMDAALRRRNLEMWVEADERFHRTITELCGNTRLAAMADMLWDQGHRAHVTTVRLRTSLERSNEEHRAILEAIQRGDWRQARAGHGRHRVRTTHEIIEVLEHYRL
ncbi:MAG: GntR family transcriptional regulator, partial [Vicinamibacteraceae bacterium]